jgi:hypothetical protein
MTWIMAHATGIINIITSPTAFFPALRQKPSFAFPLILVLIAGVATLTVYFFMVDFAWLTSGFTSSDSTPTQAAMTEPVISPTLLTVTSLSGVLIVTPLALLLYAAYFLLVDKTLHNKSHTFKFWFSMVCWCSIPALFISISSCINIILADNGRIPLNEINPLTFNSLFFHLTPGDDFFALLSSLDLSMLWSKTLMFLGFRESTQASVSLSIAIVLTPTLFKYMAWALLIVS